MARSRAQPAEAMALDGRRARQLEIGDRLDVVNAAVAAALVGGEDREYAIQLLERAWVQMALRDLHGRTTALGRTWEQLMLQDVELATQMNAPRLRTQANSSGGV